MKIAQVSPLFESVPPKLYGGTERIVSYLTEELVKQGHEVTLFATGDSVTSARLVAPWCCALRLQLDCQDQFVHHVRMVEMVMREAENFDIIHFHIDYVHYSLTRRMSVPSVTTIHGRLNMPDLVPLYNEFRDIPLVSISDAQRQPQPDSNWVATVWHGLPRNIYRYYDQPGKYLAFIGRFSPEKRVERAIQVAIETGIPLKIAAKVEKKDEAYYEQVVKPLLDHPLIEYVGEIGESEKDEFLGNAMALMFLIDWPEPFGLVMIESMACGTPVIAWRNGSVPEVIDHGVSGFIVESMEQTTEAVRNIGSLSRQGVRATFEKRFVAERMTADYLRVYQSLIKEKQNSERLFISSY